MYYQFDKGTFELRLGKRKCRHGYRTKFISKNGCCVNKMYIGIVRKQCLTKRTSAVRWIEYDVFYRGRRNAQKRNQDWTTWEVLNKCNKEFKKIRDDQLNDAIQRRQSQQL